MTFFQLGPPPDAFQAYVGDSGVAATVAMYYTLHLTRMKDKVGIMRGKCPCVYFLHSFSCLYSIICYL